MSDLLLDGERKPHTCTMSEEELNGLLAGLNDDPIVIGEEAFAIIEKAIEEKPMSNAKLQAFIKRYSLRADSES